MLSLGRFVYFERSTIPLQLPNTLGSLLGNRETQLLLHNKRECLRRFCIIQILVQSLTRSHSLVWAHFPDVKSGVVAQLVFQIQHIT